MVSIEELNRVPSDPNEILEIIRKISEKWISGKTSAERVVEMVYALTNKEAIKE